MISEPEIHGLSKLQCAVNFAIQRTLQQEILRSRSKDIVSPRTFMQLKRGNSVGGSQSVNSGLCALVTGSDSEMSELEMELSEFPSFSGSKQDYFVSDEMLACALTLNGGKRLMRNLSKSLDSLVAIARKG